MNHSSPVAVITGASSGIGAIFARRLSKQGYRLILVARRRDRLETLAAELAPAEILVADLATDPGLLLVEKRMAAEPNLEFLINNAGFGVPGCFWKTDLQALDRMHRLHIIAIERLTHAALQIMVERGRGSIINVSSVAGFLHTAYALSYCATKAWINRFTEGLYVELKAANSPVRVQTLCPGFTHSEFHESAGMDPAAIPRYLWMTADEVVEKSLQGLKRNKLVVVPGWHNRMFLILYRCLPQFLRHIVAIKYGSRSQGIDREP